MFSAQLTNAEAHLVILEAGTRRLMEHEFDHNIRKHLMFENENGPFEVLIVAMVIDVQITIRILRIFLLGFFPLCPDTVIHH